MTTTDWFAPLAVNTEPLVDPRRLPSGDWRQDAEYAQPLWDETAANIARRVSIENGRGLYALCLDPSEAELEALLRLGRWWSSGAYRIGVVESARPVEDGFLRRLRLSRDRDAPSQPAEPMQLVRAFQAVERTRIGDIEDWLRGRYGRDCPDDQVFDWIDYPVFDCGTMVLGHAVLIHGPELHVWSRAHHAHK